MNIASRMLSAMPPSCQAPFAPGEWTDDTSMALCLAESLVERNGFDGRDQLRRYVRWMDEGHWSSTGRCFDVGNVVRRALATGVGVGAGVHGLEDRQAVAAESGGAVDEDAAALAHIFFNALLPAQPVWVSEGLADLCFARDVAVTTPWGLVALNPALGHRSVEVDHLLAAMQSQGIRPIARIEQGTIEGGDVRLAIRHPQALEHILPATAGDVEITGIGQNATNQFLNVSDIYGGRVGDAQIGRAGARAAGLQTAWMNRRRSPWPAGFLQADGETLGIKTMGGQLFSVKAAEVAMSDKATAIAELKRLIQEDGLILSMSAAYPRTHANEAARWDMLLGFSMIPAVVTGDRVLPTAVPTDPLIYRFYELVSVYGTTFKALIHEEFGDGIMSAIDFKMDLKREAHPAGDRVSITMSGKFLPYKTY